MNKNKRLLGILIVGVIGMFGFCYLMVPLFYILCREAGINGKGAMQAVSISPTMLADKTRTIKVQFATILHHNINFKFIPLIRQMNIHPGEGKLIYFYAENRTGDEKIVQAIPSITPADAARYLKKTECFCFTQQYFFKGEKADMPVYFYIDPSVPRTVKEITLSYTLFDAKGYERKQKHFTKGRIDL